MADDKNLVATQDLRLSGTAITEMTQREAWNKKNPPTEATIVKNLKTTDLVAAGSAVRELGRRRAAS